jgi:hypothetical protein
MAKLVGGVVLLAGSAGALVAQEVDFALLVDTGTPASGITAIGDTLFVAGDGATVAARSRLTGALDPAFGGDGVLGNGAGEQTFSAAAHLATDGVRLFVSDDTDNLVYAIVPATGALDPAIGGDGIIGNDTGGANPEPTLTNIKGVAVAAGKLFVADFGNNIDQYQLDGLGGTATSLTNSLGPVFIVVGPTGSAGPCNLASTFPGNALLYASDFNDDISCVDSTGTVQLLLNASSLAMRNHVFATPTGANCSTLSTFSDGSVLYSAEANGSNELRCTGSNGTSFLSNDADTSFLFGIVRASGGHLYATGGNSIFESVLALPVELLDFGAE